MEIGGGTRNALEEFDYTPRRWHYMLNENTVSQIISLANQGADAEEISKELVVDKALVKLTLRANKVGTEDDRDINDAQLMLLRKRAFDLCFVEDAAVSSRMTQFLIERDKPRDKGNTGVNFTAINNALIVAQEEFAKLQASYKGDKD